MVFFYVVLRRRVVRLLLANPTNARQKVASLGIPPICFQLHSLRRMASTCGPSRRARDGDRSNAGFAKTARGSTTQPWLALLTPQCQRPALDSHYLQHRDDCGNALGQRAEFFLWPRGQEPLKREPELR